MEELEQTVVDLYPSMREEFHKLTSVDYPEMNWEKLMEIVEFIENIDDKTGYSWQPKVDGKKLKREYNFNGYSVQIEGKGCTIWLHLQLDPFELVAKSGKVNSKFDAVLDACYKFALKRNNNEI